MKWWNSVGQRAVAGLAKGLLAVIVAALVGATYVLLRTVLNVPANLSLLLTLALVAAGLIGAVAVHRAQTRDNSVLAVMWATTPWLPGALAVGIVTLILLSGSPAAVDPAQPGALVAPRDSTALAVGVGILATLIAWVSAGLLLRHSASAENANPRNFAQLADRRLRLESDIAALGDPRAWSATSTDQNTMAAIALAEIRGHVDALASALGSLVGRPSAGRNWLTGTGYIDLWNRVHRAEEALMILTPLPNLLGYAFHDRLRLTGSDVGNRNELQAHLDAAVLKLQDANATESVKSQARVEMRVVRTAINAYRDDQWDAIVRARNQLLKTMVFTGLTANVALALALMAGIDGPTLVAVASFYLVGAIVGLFDRLYAEAKASSIVEDYGLSDARLIVTPLASGLAAIAGVVLAAKLLLPTADALAPTVTASSTPIAAVPAATAPATTTAAPTATIAVGSPSATTAPTTADAAAALSLSETFDLQNNSGGLIIAAIFGLTPGLLIDRLQAQGDKFKTNLRTSGATDSKPS